MCTQYMLPNAQTKYTKRMVSNAQLKPRISSCINNLILKCRLFDNDHSGKHLIVGSFLLVGDTMIKATSELRIHYWPNIPQTLELTQ